VPLAVARVELAVVVALVETDGMTGDVVAVTGEVVLLADGMVAQPAARPVRHKPASSICRGREFIKIEVG
jgi:hypothetical protein